MLFRTFFLSGAFFALGSPKDRRRRGSRVPPPVDAKKPSIEGSVHSVRLSCERTGAVSSWPQSRLQAPRSFYEFTSSNFFEHRDQDFPAPFIQMIVIYVNRKPIYIAPARRLVTQVRNGIKNFSAALLSC